MSDAFEGRARWFPWAAHRRRVGALVVGATLALVTALAPPARADEDETMALAALGAFSLVDLGFVAYDLAAASGDRPLTPEWAVPQAVIGLPQYFAANLLLGVSQAEDGDLRSELRDFPELPLLLLLPAMLSTTITFHGATSAIAGDDPDLNPPSLMAASAVLGANIPFTMTGVGAGITGTWPTPLIAVPQLLIGGMTTAASSWQAARAEQPSGQVAWAMLAGWSTATLLHGGAALAFGSGSWRREGEESYETEAKRERGSLPSVLPWWQRRGDATTAGVVLGGVW